jgi:hypothetical protein
MEVPNRRINTPVKREGAERYLLLSMVSFAASVIVTRTFLQLTGYPQLGNSELHIAHVLWGGLLLFIASLLPLLLANRWAYNTSAILSGLGVGLFIDEVGKFITQSNDYFYPPAAPIIYAFFLLTVLLYLRVKRPPDRTPRAELYRILEGLTEVLDRDLDPIERSSLEKRLETIASRVEDANLQRLTNALKDYLHEEHIHLVTPELSWVHWVRHRTQPLHAMMNRKSMRWFLIIALGSMGVLALIEFVLLIAAIPAPGAAIEVLIQPLVTRGELRSAQDALWFLVRILLEGATGVLLIVSGGLFVVRREVQAIQLSTLTLIIWLTVINLLVFYLDQFGAIATTLVQFTVLTALTYYRRRFLTSS